MIPHHWHDQHFWLSSDRLLYWEQAQTLIASDLHLGKIGHFRKHGIALPQDACKHDLQRMFAAVQHFKPKTFMVVGDLFHSDANKELDWFSRWRRDFPALEILLIKGNHDILPGRWYAENNIRLADHFLHEGLFFTHDILPDEKLPVLRDAIRATISGHIHPGISIHGFSRQSVHLPCFYFDEAQCILPAFGNFTGTYPVSPNKNSDVFVLIPANERRQQRQGIMKL